VRAGRPAHGTLARMTAVPSALPDPDPADCVFCGIVEGRLPSVTVAQDERTVAFLDVNPATRGHLLVVPRGHARDLLAVDAEDLGACAVAAQALAGRLVERLGATGVNVLNACGRSAWQSVPHLHLHVVPRYDGDPLALPWHPRPADPAELARTGEQLR
jgi:histidine triad (HIT) family protein